MTFSFLRFSSLLLLASLSVAATFAAPQKKPAATAAVYKGFVVMDATSGKILLEENADVVTPPASMTKLMTFAVLHDKLASGALTLETPVKITVEDSKMGGTQVYLDSRETFSVEELIYALMIQSANDAAHALARAAAGSREAFVDLMNVKAREIGMTHTTFHSPHGLPPASRRLADGDLSTPRDFALLCRHLLLKTDVIKYTSVQKRDFAPDRQFGETQHMANHNKLLGKVAGVDGLKTGYTRGAGYCLSTTAERNGQRVIVVIMGSFGPGGQVDMGRSRDSKTIELIERGFSLLPAGGPAFDSLRPAYNSLVRPVPTITPLDHDSGTADPAPAAPEEASPEIKFSVPRR